MSIPVPEHYEAPPPLCHIVTPVGMLGYGFDEEATAHALSELTQTGFPTAIILDSGSTDSGPAKLALGSMTCPRSAYYNDLKKLLRLVDAYRTPLLFSSAGGDGTDEHVRVMESIVEEITSLEQNQHVILVISIFSGIPKETVIDRLKDGRITGCGVCVPELTKSDVELSTSIVAQVGSEPFRDAMQADPDFDIIIGGRGYDPSPYAGYCLFQLERQFPEISGTAIDQRLGGFLHMGKVMECGGLCATPKSHGAIATVFANGQFDVRPLLISSRCTPLSVAAHTLYENTRPDILRGPGGALNLTDCKYDQLDDGRTVRVRGSVFQSSVQNGLPYQLKLEAARISGYRSMFMGSVRDYILVGQIDKLLIAVKNYVAQQHADITENWDLDFHVYGKDHNTATGPSELFIVAESIAPTQQLATSIASKARIAMIHGPYPGQKATSGNFAFGIGGLMEIELGPCAQFSVYHLMELDAGEERLNNGGLTNNGKGNLIRSSTKVIGNGPQKPVSRPDRTIPQLIRPVAPEQHEAGKQVSNLRSQPPQILSDLSRVLRSKNAGPYEVTIDIIFESVSDYRAVKDSNLWSVETLTQALGIAANDIIWIGSFDPALAFKVTIPRMRGGKRMAAGGFMESDVHGSQQHNAIAMIKLPESVLAAISYA